MKLLSIPGGQRRIRDLHSILGILSVLVPGAGVHDGDVAGDEGQVVRVHPGAAEERGGARQRQETGHRRVLNAGDIVHRITSH